MSRRSRAGTGRGRRGLSSVYGFIMIYLLVMASLQAISLSLSSDQDAEAAAQQAAQVQQERSLEHLSVGLSHGGNVTVANNGLIPSNLAYLLVQNSSVSRVIQVQQALAVGASVTLVAGSGGSFPSSVAIVTRLGDVFASSPQGSAAPVGNWKVVESAIGGPGVDAQVYQNPGDPTRFFVSSGSSASAFSTKTGNPLWSFDAGQGEVTSVLPLSDGGVYVSDGYYGDQFTSGLFRLTSSGTSLASYSMRLLRLYTSLEIQYPDNDQAPYPMGSQPVQKGTDGTVAYYDGWFFSSSGLEQQTLPGDSFNLATSDATQFYMFTTAANPGGFGCSQPRGNEVTLYAYYASAQGAQNAWSSPVFFNMCDLYPDELIASSAGSGLFVSLFSETYWSQTTYYGGPYQGSSPLLAVLSSSSGTVLRSGSLDSSGYTGVATDGTNVFLAIPSTEQVEVVSATGSGGGTFHNIGIAASTLVWADNSLFAISANQVNVYDSSLNLKKAIDFSPYSFYSLSNSKPLETAMVRPSFTVLNSTSYLALLRNSTGYGSLVLGAYSP